MKIAHIADTHIKNLKYHYEYRIVFEQLYETLRKEGVECIVHCGDIAHTKTQISPEFVDMCSDFFRNLANIAPTYIILGNHDGNLKNSSRQDALTPIVEALDLQHLHLLKNSGEYPVNGSLTLNVLSVFDQDNWVDPSDDSKINIALYHGAISGVSTDIGWVMDHGEHDVGIFEGHDFAMLGDIHKTNQVLDYEGRVRYCGSTVQQNHGETNDKGFLIWDIRSKDDFTVKHHVLKNPKPFITIELTPKGRMPRGIVVPNGARLRLVSNNNLPLSRMKKAVDVAKHRFQPESITFLNRAAGQRGNVEDLTNSLETEDLRDPAIQKKLIAEYLKDYEVDDAMMERVQCLNTQYNRAVEETEEVGRNINWKLRKVQWDNLFNYGEDNTIDFEKINGIIGIFGKNYSGKSSVIDSVLYTMFNTTSKNERKNLNIINQNKNFCRGKLEVSVGDRVYNIERTSEKYIKRLKGEETLEAKTDLNFEVLHQSTGELESLNGLSRMETDRNIRKHFGTQEDFLISAMSSQHGALSFIDEGSTRRKEIIAKFLDLEIFEKKFKLANEDASDTRGALRRLDGREYDEEIEAALENLSDNNDEMETQKILCGRLKNEIVNITDEIAEVSLKIDSIPAEIIDVVKVRSELSDAKNKKIAIADTNRDNRNKRKRSEEMYEKINNFLETFDLEDLQRQQGEIENITSQMTTFQSQHNSETADLERHRKKSALLEGIPCGDSFPSCKFIKDAHVAQTRIPISESQISEINDSLAALKEQLASYEPKKVEEHLLKHKKVLERKIIVSNTIADLNLEIEKNKLASEKLHHEIKRLSGQLEEYDQNKEVIENLEGLVATQNRLVGKLNKKNLLLESCEAQILELVRQNGSLEQKVEAVREDKKEYLDLQEEFAAYDLFMRCMHSNGIAYDIIKKKLPVINQEIAKVLTNITNFEVFFEDNGKKFDIFIKHPKHDARPIEMASGAEKTMGAMAIRLAMLSVSSLPKGDLFVLDEPGTALDEDNMEGFIRILELIKVYFKNVLLISHLDSLKDCVDMQIVIDKNNGYARINQ